MAITSKESILKVLTYYNPWWKTGLVNPRMSKLIKFAFYEAINDWSRGICAVSLYSGAR